jgi:hypothetical protein
MTEKVSYFTEVFLVSIAWVVLSAGYVTNPEDIRLYDFE